MKYKDWEVLETIPEGWKIDKTAGSPMPRTVFITNGKSVLNGQKRAILKVAPEVMDFKRESKTIQKPKKDDSDYTFPAKTVNQLAREKFKEKLLNDILVDMVICEIEGWDKEEYIKELTQLIKSINNELK